MQNGHGQEPATPALQSCRGLYIAGWDYDAVEHVEQNGVLVREEGYLPFRHGDYIRVLTDAPEAMHSNNPGTWAKYYSIHAERSDLNRSVLERSDLTY